MRAIEWVGLPHNSGKLTRALSAAALISAQSPSLLPFTFCDDVRSGNFPNEKRAVSRKIVNIEYVGGT